MTTKTIALKGNHELLQQDNERYDVKYYPNGEDDQDIELVKRNPFRVVKTQMDVIIKGL